MSKLKAVLKKMEEDRPGLDADHYHEQLSTQPEGEWFMPTGDMYALFSHLYEWDLVERRNEPIWVDGNYKGQRIYFRYRNDLKYKSEA
ncbi:hypothetical protein [Paraflavitalea sp. CAU 1676]|uniref:hypothetical protein n=1 Tax=Paraflavitalea sp. CAU 1676 TaxID=3032598 RepID=UPI0023DC6CEC|nr:hypothetical protein [Paraflavitalea sp. CAU 1676]MDF2189307.1 hypothetical protein [Paraflavitalea sp. CAU 1676]